MQEIKAVIADMGVSLEEFKAAYGKRLDQVETVLGRGSFGGGGSRGDVSPAAKEHAAAFFAWVRQGNNPEALRNLEIQAALSTLDDTEGGFMVVPEIDMAVDRVLSASSAMRRVANVKKITTGEYKRLISKGGTESGWVAEKGSRDETDTPSLAEIAINAAELYANPKVTQTLLDDAAFDAAAWLEDEISIAFGEDEGAAFISGNGVGQPKGLEAYTMVANASYEWGKIGYIASGAASTFTNADKLFDLLHALKPAYRQGACWVMNDTTFAHVRKFKDGEGNYLWRPGLSEGEPDTLLGKPVEIDDNVADIGTNAYPIWFGNFKRAYTIVDRIGIRVLRDPYSEKPFVYFYTTKRVGGAVTMYEAIKALKVAAS